MKTFQYYSGRPQVPPPDEPVAVPSVSHNRKLEAAAYVADESLADAVNVALLLGQPLLLTGEPGTGKTQLAYSVGRELGYRVLRFETKSTSVARDLFYTYDTLRRFHDAQRKVKRDGKQYITYNPLGIAILRSQPSDMYQKWLPSTFEHLGQQRSIVLIDEIDKAPRDFPNDLLSEIEGMYFSIPELGMGIEKIEANEELRPIIFITSNSEKSLPDAFLRRCIYYDIPFPKRDHLIEIVLSHMTVFGGSKPAWLEDALDFFLALRAPNLGLDKKPATAELLKWIMYLQKAQLGEAERLRTKAELMSSSLIVLLKSKSDVERAETILDEWKVEPLR
jgi:MoxR-like ATPase